MANRTSCKNMNLIFGETDRSMDVPVRTDVCNTLCQWQSMQGIKHTIRHRFLLRSKLLFVQSCLARPQSLDTKPQQANYVHVCWILNEL